MHQIACAGGVTDQFLVRFDFITNYLTDSEVMLPPRCHNNDRSTLSSLTVQKLLSRIKFVHKIAKKKKRVFLSPSTPRIFT